MKCVVWFVNRINRLIKNHSSIGLIWFFNGVSGVIFGVLTDMVAMNCGCMVRRSENFSEMHSFVFHKNKKDHIKVWVNHSCCGFGLNYSSNDHFTFGFLAFQINAQVLERKKNHCISNEHTVSLDIVSYGFLLFLCGLVLSQP